MGTRIAVLAAAWLHLLIGVAQAGTPTPTPVFTQSIVVGLGESTNATPGTSASPIVVVDCTSSQSSYNCNNLGAKLNSLVITSTDTASRAVTCGILRSGTFSFLFVKATAVATATASTSINGFASTTVAGLPIDEGTNSYIYLTVNDKLVCFAAAVTSGKVIYYTSIGGAF